MLLFAGSQGVYQFNLSYCKKNCHEVIMWQSKITKKIESYFQFVLVTNTIKIHISLFYFFVLLHTKLQ